MDKGRLLNLARRFKRIYESGKPYIPGSSWTLTQHQQGHDRRVERAQRLLSLEHIPRLTEAELRELFADTDALNFWKDKDGELDRRLSGEGTERIRSALLSLFQIAETELTPAAFSKAQQTRGLGTVLISELLSYRFPSRYYPCSSKVTLRALKKLGEDVKAAQPHGKKGDHYLYFALRPLMDEICNALRIVGLTEVDYMLADVFFELVVNTNDGLLPRYWKISPGERAEYWNEFKKLNCIAIGWSRIGDLRRFNSQEEIKDFMVRDEWEGRLSYTSEQLWWISHEIQAGDKVFAYGGKKILGVGEILEGYDFRQDDVMHFAHRRPVKWNYLESKPISNLPRDLQGKLARTETIICLSEQEGQQVMALYDPSINPPEPNGPQDGPNLSRYFAAHGLHFTPYQLATFYTALKTKGFVILTGISGTGKTKLAQYFAELLGSKDQFHFAAVRPDWRDSKSLLGYFNPLLGEEGQFQSTEFLGFILEATEQYRGSGDSKREDLLALVEKLIEFDSPPTRADLPEEAQELVQRQPGIQRISRETFAEILDLAAVADHFDLSQVTQTFLLRLHEVSPYADEPRKQYHFRMGIPGSRQLSGSLSKGEKVAFVYYSPDRGLWAAGTFDRMERRESRASPHIPYFILLDEMNLAKVEYYFADLLSVLESGRQPDGFTKEAIRFQYPEGIDGPPPQLYLPPNLYFIGTVNVDETTYMFSPKVLDRAFTLELSTVEFPQYINSTTESEFELPPDEQQRLLDDFTRGGKFATIGKSEKEQIKAFAKQPDGEYKTYVEHLTALNTLLQLHDLHFGYRVFDEIMMFLANAEGSPVFDGFGSDGLDAAFDAAVLMKVLSKFHGTRGKLRLPLLNVFAWAMTPDVGYEMQRQVGELEKEISGSEEKEETRLDLIGKLRESPGEARIRGETFTYPCTALKALRMPHDLYTTGFASFA
jgi:5-methylcytosine-specific restriction protein B